MQQAIASQYNFIPVSSGPDWITATARTGRQSLEFEVIADEYLQKKRDAGGAIHAASRFGYRGYSTDHFFHGRRVEDQVLIVSSHDTPDLAIPIIQAASNVSRLDLQVTVWTSGEQPHLGIEGYQRLTANRHLAYRPGQVTLIQSDPSGETLNVNKRTSDRYGRLYDKATEAKLGAPRTLWRYEVEFKRRAAMAHAADLVASSSMAASAKHRVHSFWRGKGLEPAFTLENDHISSDLRIEASNHDVLSWFENSVSITVARAVREQGLRVTLAALGLSALVEPIQTERS